MVEDIVHAIDILSATPGGTLILMIIFLVVLAVALSSGGMIYLMVRMNGSANKQSDALGQQAEIYSGLLSQLTSASVTQTHNATKQAEAVDKVGDALIEANHVQAEMKMLSERIYKQHIDAHARVDLDHEKQLAVAERTAGQNDSIINEIATARSDLQIVLEGLQDAVGRMTTSQDVVLAAVDSLCKAGRLNDETMTGLLSEMNAAQSAVLTSIDEQLESLRKSVEEGNGNGNDGSDLSGVVVSATPAGSGDSDRFGGLQPEAASGRSPAVGRGVPPVSGRAD